MRNLTPEQLDQLIKQGPLTLVDVREAEELELARFEGARHIPLAELPGRLGELDQSGPIVLVCHHGVRSELAGRMLERSGFSSVMHLSGGIDAWSDQIDPAIPRY